MNRVGRESATTLVQLPTFGHKIPGWICIITRNFSKVPPGFGNTPSPFISSMHTCNPTVWELKRVFYPEEMRLHLMPTTHCSQPLREFGCMRNHPISWNSLWARVTSLISAFLNIISMRQIVPTFALIIWKCLLGCLCWSYRSKLYF